MSNLAVQPSKELDFSREKIELIKRTVAKGATDLELELFFHACKRTGLDPLMKQIYCIKRWSNEENRYVMAIQTGIDGYRLIADRTGCYAGNDEPQFEMDPDGGNEGYPVKATVTVWKLVNGQRCAFTASARWAEYAQKTKQGGYNKFWRDMGFGQLGKCAEALALRKAFPAELSGVYTHEEMQQADEQKPVYTNDAKKKISELMVEGVAVEPDGAGHAETQVVTQQARDEAPLTDDTWDLFLDYMSDDPDRSSVGKQLKSVLKIGKVADLKDGARVGFIREFQKSCAEVGVPCSEWVK